MGARPARTLVAVLLVAVGLAVWLAPSAAADSAWFPPDTLSEPGGGAFDPQVALDDDGNSVAVWLQFDGSTATCCNRVQASFRPVGGPAYSPQTLSTPDRDAFDPQVAFDANGNALAIWARDAGTNSRIQVASLNAGATTFGAPQTISVPGKPATKPQLAFDQDGTAVAVWVQSEGTQARIQAAVRPPGGSFGAEEPISPTGVSSFAPRVAMAGGLAIAVWYSDLTGTLRVQSAVRQEGNYVRPQGAAQLRVPLVVAYSPCDAGSANRTHGPTLTNPSCNPPAQSSSVLTVGTTDANGFSPQSNGSFQLTMCANGTTGSGTCSTPSGMTSPDVRITVSATDVRCRATNTACPAGAASDFTGTLAAAFGLRITDKQNGALESDPATVQDITGYVPVQCSETGPTIGAACSIVTSQNTILPGSVVAAKRTIWDVAQVQLQDPGPNGSGYGAGCPSTCGDGDEGVFMRQGIFIP